MPYIKRFIVNGLAGRQDSYGATLNEEVNVFFGPNGSGKTSLLRILHSALTGDATTLEDVPFTRAEVTIQPYHVNEEEVLILDREVIALQSAASAEPSEPRLFSARRRRPGLEWTKNPPDAGNWPHRYLPISRLYTSASTDNLSLYGGESTSEKALESRFDQGINRLWKDYVSEMTRSINTAQEEGLARILESVISRSESYPEDSTTDPAAAYTAVANFLTRRQMEEIIPIESEFRERYQNERQLRSVAKDIEAIEKRISVVTAPREHFKGLVERLFYGGKTLKLSSDTLGVTAGEKKLELGTLSSGEKQLLWILLEAMMARTSVILVDEPELSMHVDWQRRLVSAMRTVSPLAQMILATHSPEIMADLEDAQIFRL